MMNKIILASVLHILICLQFQVRAQTQARTNWTQQEFQLIDENFILTAANGGIIEVANRAWYLKYNGRQIITSFALDTASNQLATVETDTLQNTSLYLRSISADGIQTKVLIKTLGTPERIVANNNKMYLVERQDSTWVLYELHAGQKRLIKISLSNKRVKQVLKDEKDESYFFATPNAIYKKSANELSEVCRTDDEILHFEAGSGRQLYISTTKEFYVFENGILNPTAVSIRGSFKIAGDECWHLDEKGNIRKQIIK